MGTDSNDLHAAEGAESVARALVAAATLDAAEDDAPPLIVADLTGFATRDLPPPRYAVAQLVPRGYVTLLGAHGGAGKSMLGLILAAHVAAGVPWAGLPVTQGRSVFVSLEDQAQLILHRLRRIVSAYGLPPEPIMENLTVLDGADVDAAMVFERVDFGVRTLVQTAAMLQLFRAVSDARLVVVDNASDAFDANENERRMVRGFVRMLGKLARNADAGVLLLAHIDKTAARHGGNGNTYSGSTAWHNSARSRLALVEASGTLELRQEKNNLGKLADPLALIWTDEGVLIPGGQGVVAAQATTAALLASVDAEHVRVALEAAHAVGEPVSASHTGPGNAHVLLSTFGLPVSLLGGAGRRRFWKAVERLIADGVASVETVQNEQRKERRRIVLRQLRQLRQSPVPPDKPAHFVRAGSSCAPKAQTGANRRTDANANAYRKAKARDLPPAA